MLLWKSEGAIPDVQGRDPLQDAREYRQRMVHCVHPPQHASPRQQAARNDGGLWVGRIGRAIGGGVPDLGIEDDDSETPSPGFEEFRAKLVTHFSVAWTKREVVWFQRAAVAEA